MSLPTQQIARTFKMNGQITEKQKEELKDYLPIDELSWKYNESFADPVKFTFRNNVDKVNFTTMKQRIKFQKIILKNIQFQISLKFGYQLA